MNMEKKEKLSEKEQEQLKEFYSKCVDENATFPSPIPGTNDINIIELVHYKSIQTLDRIADTLEKGIQNVSRTEKRKGISEKTLKNSTISYKDAIDAIDLLIKKKEYEEYSEKIKNEISELKSKIDDLSSPEELKIKFIEKLKTLEQ
jgi:uncharacterized protein YukE